MKQALNIGIAAYSVDQIIKFFKDSQQKHFANVCRMEFQRITRDATFHLPFKVNSKHLDYWNP